MARILGLEPDRTTGRVFVEICDAVSRLTREAVYFMGHRFAVPRDAIAYHWENEPLSLPATLRNARAVWDFSTRNVARYSPTLRGRVRHVPCGHHPSMEGRFRLAPEPEHDVVWVGDLNPRRRYILAALERRGLSILRVPPGTFGPARDRLLARAKVLLNIRFYASGIFPVLRSAHAVANLMPVVSEVSPEIPPWANRPATYDAIVDRTVELVRASPEQRRAVAREALAIFRRHPLRLPTDYARRTLDERVR